VGASPITHLVTLSFDDGFRKSFAETARIHEELSLKACLNVFTESCKSSFKKPDSGHNAATGDWELWNELAGRGHEVMPHGYDHSNHARIPFEDSRWRIETSIGEFERNLKGFKIGEAVFNFPYNAASAAVLSYMDVSSNVGGYRIGGGWYNVFPSGEARRINTSGHGPENCESHLDAQLEEFLAGSGGWFVYNLHGLDGEGWGPVGSDYLRRLLTRLLERDGVEILPAAAALKKYGARRPA